MKEYNKPELIAEDIEIEDICAESSGQGNTDDNPNSGNMSKLFTFGG